MIDDKPISPEIANTYIWSKNEAFLSVCLFYHGAAIEGLEVRFYECGEDDKPGKAIGESQISDENGMAKYDKPVLARNYLCEIENQPLALISAVGDKEKPFIIILPIGNSYFDSDGNPEFEQPDES